MIIGEMDQIHAYLTQNRGHLPNDVWDMTVRAQADFLQGRFNAGGFSVQDATVIGDKLEQGPWPADVRSILRSALASSVSRIAVQSLRTSSTTVDRKKTQTLVHWCKFVNMKRWTAISSNESPLGQVMEAAVDVMDDLNCHNPSERTTQHVVAALLLGAPSLSESTTPAAKYDLVKEFKRLLKNRTVNSSSTDRVVDYPDSVSGLPRALQLRFTGLNTPVDTGLKMVDITNVSKTIPLRVTSRAVASPQQREHDANPGMQFQRDMFNMMMQFVSNASGARSDQQIRLTRGRSRRALELPGDATMRLREPEPDLAALDDDTESGAHAHAAPRDAEQAHRCAPPVGGTLALTDQSHPAEAKPGLPAPTGKPMQETAEQQAQKMLDAMQARGAHGIAPGTTNTGTTKKGPMRRPAASKTTAKATAKAKANAKGSKKDVPGWTIQERDRAYPNGCSKCAYKVKGCTLSCFKARGQV